MTPPRNRTVIEFPSELEVVARREYEAPIQLVFDVLWKPEHLRKTIAPFEEEVTECSVDLRVGGNYRYVFVTDDGTECGFHGTFLEVEPPTRTVQTWLFEGWPDAQAVETMELTETASGTDLTWTLAFADKAGRDHMTKYDGIEANFENVADYLATLQNH